jgi:hypothetical protein
MIDKLLERIYYTGMDEVENDVCFFQEVNIFIYVAKAQKKPGFVCLWVGQSINDYRRLSTTDILKNLVTQTEQYGRENQPGLKLQARHYLFPGTNITLLRV